MRHRLDDPDEPSTWSRNANFLSILEKAYLGGSGEALIAAIDTCEETIGRCRNRPTRRCGPC